MDNDNHNEGIETILDKYERSQAEAGDGGMSTVARAPGRVTATSVIAQVDSKGIYKNDKVKELLVDLCSRTNFRSRSERIFFLDWVSWCHDFKVGYDEAILYIATARSENAESIKQLIEALTSVRQHQYVHGEKGKEKLQTNGQPLSSG